MSSNVLAFWKHLEDDSNLHEQALLAGEMDSRQSAAAYLAGLAGGSGFAFTPEEYLRTVQGFTLVVRTPIGPIRLAPGPAVPERAFSESFYLKHPAGAVEPLRSSARDF